MNTVQPDQPGVEMQTSAGFETPASPAHDYALVDHALAYAKHGWAVFPVKPYDKKPLTPNGLKDGTTDPAQIRRWWDKWPDANIATPIPAGRLVVDVDVQNGGTLAQLGDMPQTVTARTGGGGWHLWTRVPSDVPLTGKFRDLTGIDVRKEGNYVVLPPSIHKSGNRYAWESGRHPFTDDVPIAPLPTHLLDRVRAPLRQPHAPRPATPAADAADPNPDKVAAYFLERAKERAADDGRNNTGLWLALQLRDNGMSMEDAEGLMLDYQAEVEMWKSGDTYTAQEALNSLRQAYSREAREPTTFSEPRGATAEEDQAADDLPLGHRLADIIEQRVDWLWPGRIPLGMITMLDGDPGTGKSMMLASAAARVTCGGAFPDHTEVGAPGTVILISLEDDPARTVRPRLRLAGADLSRVISMPTVPYRASDGTVQERPFSLPTDFPVLRRAIQQYNARLVIIDPIMGALDSSVDAHKDQDVRSKIASPMKQLAEETSCAIVLVRHLSKGGTDSKALYRGGGSIAWSGAARSDLMVFYDPDDEKNERRVLATVKCNLSKPPTSWVYRIAADEQGIGYAAWIGADKRTASDLNRAERAKERARGTLGDSAQAVLAYVTGRSPAPVTIADVAQASGLDDDAARQCLHRLATAGRIQKLGRGQFYLPETPEQREKAQEHKAMCARMHITDPFATEVPDVTAAPEHVTCHIVTKDVDVSDIPNVTPPATESQTPSQQDECDNVTCDSCDSLVTNSPATAEDQHQHRVYVDDHGLWHCGSGCKGHWATEDLPAGSQRTEEKSGKVVAWTGHAWEQATATTYFATCAKCGGPMPEGGALYCDACLHRKAA